MKRFLIIILLLVGCTSFEIVDVIHPEVTIIGKEVGVIYKLGKLTVSDTWRKVDSDKIEYLKNPENKKKFTLHVRFDGSQNSTAVYFFYYVNGIHFARTENAVSEEILLANMDSIDNFFLHKLDGKELTEKNEEVIEKKIAEIKKEVKVAEIESGKYSDDDGKW